MALTAAFNPSSDTGPVVPGSRRRAFITFTLDSSYPTNGYSLPTTIGFTNVHAVLAGGTTSTGKPVFWTGSKLKVFSAIGTEVSNATDLSTETTTVEIIGI